MLWASRSSVMSISKGKWEAGISHALSNRKKPAILSVIRATGKPEHSATHSEGGTVTRERLVLDLTPANEVAASFSNVYLQGWPKI